MGNKYPAGTLAIVAASVTRLKLTMPSEMLNTLLEKDTTGTWIKREYADLTEQWATLGGSQHDLFLELMAECSPGYRVVSRKMAGDTKDKCPPVISGPHDTLEAGKAAYLIALATL